MDATLTEALALIKLASDSGSAIVNAVQQYARKINPMHLPTGMTAPQAEVAAAAAAWALSTLGAKWWFRTVENSSSLDYIVGESKLGTAYAMTGAASPQVKRLLFCSVLVSAGSVYHPWRVRHSLEKVFRKGAEQMRNGLFGLVSEEKLLELNLVYLIWTDALIADIRRLAYRVTEVETPFVGHQVLGTDFQEWAAVLSAAGVDQPIAAHTGLLRASNIVGILHKYGYAYYFGSQAFIGTHPRPYQLIDYDLLAEETNEHLRSLDPQFKEPIGSATRLICTQNTGTSISLVAAAAVISLEQKYGDIWIHCCKYQDVVEHAAAALAAALRKETVVLDDSPRCVLKALTEDLIVGQFTNDCWGPRYYSTSYDYSEISSLPLVLCAAFACTATCSSMDSSGLFDSIVPFTDATPLGVSYSLFEKNETLYWRVVKRGITIALFAHRAVWPFTPKVIESLRQHKHPSPSTTAPKERRPVNFFGLLDAAIDFEDADQKVRERNWWLHVCVDGNATARAAAIVCGATLSIENFIKRHDEEQATTPQFSVVVDDWIPGG
ncbi:unnamed protein product [Umbelopsis vinacea]